jgi:hypothetical protein
MARWTFCLVPTGHSEAARNRTHWRAGAEKFASNPSTTGRTSCASACGRADLVSLCLPAAHQRRRATRLNRSCRAGASAQVPRASLEGAQGRMVYKRTQRPRCADAGAQRGAARSWVSTRAWKSADQLGEGDAGAVRTYKLGHWPNHRRPGAAFSAPQQWAPSGAPRAGGHRWLSSGRWRTPQHWWAKRSVRSFSCSVATSGNKRRPRNCLQK